MSKSIIKQFLPIGIILPIISSCSQPETPVPEVLKAYLEYNLPKQQQPESGYNAYFDLSDGLLSAYQDQGISNCLKSVVNKITGNDKCQDIYTLKNSVIDKCELRQTDLYNYILNPKSYQMIAPIEQSLGQITADGRSALLITDFEEYCGGAIQQQNYAKKYFIDWLGRGNRIVFFVFNYQEKKKDKHLYFTVFDTPDHTLLNDVELALEGNGANYSVFRLNNDDITLPVNYGGPNKGGAYHDNETGEDIISLTKEDGQGDCYTRFDGLKAEFYPFEESMPNIVQNVADAKLDAQEHGGAYTPQFAHLISGLQANFEKMTGYEVKGLDVRVTDIQGDYDKFAGYYDFKNSGRNADENGNILPEYDYAKGPGQISEKQAIFAFAGSVNGNVADVALDLAGSAANAPEGDLLRVDVVISDCAPRYDVLPALFEWDGNRSLIEAVKNTLQEQNPKGRVIYSYFIKGI